MRDLQRFEVIGRAKELTLRCYRLTSRLPGSERFGLVSQMNRAAVSIAANLAEGVGRGTQGDFERHLRIGQGSAESCESSPNWRRISIRSPTAR